MEGGWSHKMKPSLSSQSGKSPLPPSFPGLEDMDAGWKYFTTEFLLRLSGHTDEVHSVDLRGGLLVSGAADTTVAKTTNISNVTIVPIKCLQSVYI